MSAEDELSRMMGCFAAAMGLVVILFIGAAVVLAGYGFGWW